MTILDGAGHDPLPDRARGAAGRQPRWVTVALGLFPDAWRTRYGAEFGALLEATPISLRIAFDVLVAAVDAHVHPTGPRRRWPLMIERLRLSELTVFASWVLFVVAGLAFQRMTDGAPFGDVAANQAAVAWAYAGIVVGAVVSLVAVVVAGVPIALAIARTALGRGQWRPIGLLAVPPLALALWIGLTVGLIALGDPQATGAVRVAVFLAWVGTFVVAAAASTIAVGAAALDAEVDASLYRRAVLPALVTAVAMVLAALAVIAWGVAVAVAAPASFWGFDGLLGSSTSLTWLGVAVAMGGAAASASRAALRARGQSVA